MLYASRVRQEHLIKLRLLNHNIAVAAHLISTVFCTITIKI